MDSGGSGDPCSDHIPAQLCLLMMLEDEVVVSMVDNKLYIGLDKVSTTNKVEDVLKILREKSNEIDMVICDVNSPDMAGLELLKVVVSSMNIPVTCSKLARILKGTLSANPYALKHLAMDATTLLKNMQFAFQKKNNIGTVVAAENPVSKHNISQTAAVNEGLKRKMEEQNNELDRISSNALKKQRVVWSPELHQAFARAVQKLGLENAVPKKILELMDVPGLTRENVASHLQKYRINIKRQQTELKRKHNGCARVGSALANNTQSGMNAFTSRAHQSELAISNPIKNTQSGTPAFMSRTHQSELAISNSIKADVYGCENSSLKFVEDRHHTSSFGNIDMRICSVGNDRNGRMSQNYGVDETGHQYPGLKSEADFPFLLNGLSGVAERVNQQGLAASDDNVFSEVTQEHSLGWDSKNMKVSFGLHQHYPFEHNIAHYEGSYTSIPRICDLPASNSHAQFPSSVFDHVAHSINHQTHQSNGTLAHCQHRIPDDTINSALGQAYITSEFSGYEVQPNY